MPAAPKKRKKSLYLMTLILLIIASLTPVIGSLFLFVSNVWNQQAEQAEASARFYSAQLFNSSTISMNTLQSAAEYLISEDKIRAVMTAEPGTPVDQTLLPNTLGQMILFDSAWQTANISSLYIFRNDGTSFSLYGSDKYDTQYRRIHAIYEEYNDFSSARTLVPGQNGSCYFVLDYTDYHTYKPLGKIIFEVKISDTLSVNALRSAYPSASVVLSTTDGELLTNQSVYSNLAVIAALADNRQQSYESTDELNGEMHFHRRQRVSGYNLYIDVYLPQSEVFGSLRSTAALFTGSLVLLLILISALAIWAARMLFAPIHKITQTMGRMADGDLSFRMEEQSFRETEQIATAFNSMADHLEELYRDAYDKGIRLRATEYQLLEAQINPHFIFNVLETVNMRCLAAGHRDISHIVTDLAELLRFNLRSHKRQKITFEEELRYVRYYLDLQKARFQNALEYEIDYEDESLLQYYLPRLTIQPLVENAVVHGLEPRQSGGQVTVKIWEEDESIYVRIHDNGVGFDPTRKAEPATLGSKHNRIALPNIRERLRLLYGDKALLRINSIPGAGTSALLILPIDEKEV